MFFSRTFLKFLCVGLINTIVGAGVMFLLYNVFHFSYWVSSAFNYVVGGLVSFFLNKFFTFKNQEKNPLQILAFAASVAICYLVAYSLARPIAAYFLKDASLKYRDNISLLVGMCVYTLLNYFFQKFVVFRKKKG